MLLDFWVEKKTLQIKNIPDPWNLHVFPWQNCCTPSRPPFFLQMSKSLTEILWCDHLPPAPIITKIHEIAFFFQMNLTWYHLISSHPSLHLKTCNERKLINPVVTRGMTISMGIKNPGNTGFTSFTLEKSRPFSPFPRIKDQPIFTFMAGQPTPPTLRNSLIRPYSGKPMVNKTLTRGLIWGGGWVLRGEKK